LTEDGVAETDLRLVITNELVEFTVWCVCADRDVF